MARIQRVEPAPIKEFSIDLYRRLLDRGSDLILVVELATGRIADVNETTCRVLGYARAELLAMNIAQVTGEDDQALRSNFVQLREANVLRWEGIHIRRDGSRFPVEATLSLVDGVADYVVAVGRDSTARRHAEENMVRLTSALEQAADSIVITDVQGRIEYVNASFERLTGYARAEVIGENPRILNSGRQSPELYQTMWQTLSRGETWAANMVNRRKDGTTYHQQTTISAVRDRTGAVVNYIGVGRDIEREIQLEAQLAQALRHTETVLDASPVGILSYKATGESTGANQAAAAIVGGTVEKLRAQNFHQIASWKPCGLYDAALAALETRHEQSLDVELTSSFGKTVSLGCRCVPFEFAGEPHLMVMMTDQTEHKALEAQFLQAQKMEAIGRLAGGIAHDFNNILAVIMSFSNFIREVTPPDDERNTDIQEVLKAVDRGASLTRQLLIFSRQQPSEKQPTDLNQSLRMLSKFLARAVGADIRINMTPASTPIVVEIDPVQFDQILLNLAVNARDAMPLGGTLSIAVGQTGAHAHLTVTDSGIGMTPETQQRIFEPFFTTKDRGKGTGLGLATCFGIVSDAGGTIRVDSTPGRGSTFTIDLPLCADVPAAHHETTLGEQRGHGEVVLVAEDEVALRRAMVRLLESAGYTVYAAPDGDAAVRKIDELGSELRLVVSDIMMPGRSGRDVARHLAQVAPRTPILLTSGYVDDSDRSSHDDLVLWKPVRPPDLLRAVATALAGSELPSLPPSELQGPLPTVGTRRERVLIVEDELAIAHASQRCLERAGFEVEVATTLAEARAAVAAGEPDVLISDLGLPDGSGLDLIDDLHDRRIEIPILIVTGSSSVAMASSAVHARVHEYLVKPVPAAELRRAVRAAAESGRMMKLRTKLLAARFGHDDLLRDLPATERNFAAALSSLRMVFQPIVRACDHVVVAHEALVRSDEPTLSSALALVSAAEALGRIDDLGRAVRTAVAQTLATRDGPETCFVNVHPMEFRLDTLGDPHDPLSPFAHRIVLEVTECASLETGPKLDATLAHLRRLGYRIALDDLGEGYASLTSLIHLRPEFAKIDMSLVRNVHEAPLKREVIASVVDLARRSGLTTIAEGVETSEERDALVALGCDLLQGYLFGRPTPR